MRIALSLIVLALLLASFAPGPPAWVDGKYQNPVYIPILVVPPKLGAGPGRPWNHRTHERISVDDLEGLCYDRG